MTFDRRGLFTAGAGLGLAAVGATASAAGPRKSEAGTTYPISVDLNPGTERDQSAIMQRAIEKASLDGVPVSVPPGRFYLNSVTLKPGTRLVGAEGLTTFVALGGGAVFRAEGADRISLKGFRVEGQPQVSRLVELRSCKNVVVEDVELAGVGGAALVLEMCSGRVAHCHIEDVSDVGVFCRDSVGIEIIGNQITRCGNNGIQVWRSREGQDGTRIEGNTISKVSSRDGGTGQNGNGINVFRAGDVAVNQNRIVDCSYSAIRGNAASNIQMVGNVCSGIGEVALYAEFGFRGAVICANLIDTAATGISVTNFDRGGGLATVQGNLVRNLFRREHEYQDKRGHGISVEADASVTGNTIESAPTAGLAIGWGPYMRDVIATGNVIRKSKIGVLVSSDAKAGACLIANNMISGTVDGAIRAMDHGVPHGPDLAKASVTPGRVLVNDNLAV